MKDIDQIRRENLKLLELEAGSPTSAAKLAGMSLAQFANLREGAKDSKTGKPRGMRKETARKIEASVGKPVGWLDVDHSNAPPEHASDTPPTIARPWPFPSIPEADIRALDRVQIGRLEGAMALVIAQLKMPVKTLPPRRTAGGLVDIDAATDEFPMDIPALRGQFEADAARTPRKAAPLASGAVDGIRPAPPPPANDELVDVPELGDVRLAAGEGHENETEHQTGVMQFRRSFLRSVGADNNRARVVYAKGDSMEPIISDGSALLMVLDEHLMVRDLAAGGIYAIRYDGKTMVKKVIQDKLTGKWVAQSFNAKKYQDVSLENGVPVRVLGRVVWAGTTLA